METFKRTPLQLFNLPQHFIIPLFQRPYVWKEAEQWEPLWKDIRRVAELRIAEPHLNATHFLGAVVIQAHEAQSKRLTAWNVIDGQQRLTTLQVLADAACALLAQAGFDKLAGQLEDLTLNAEKYVEDGESRLKVRHLNKDHAAFDEVMTAEPPVDHGDLRHAESQIVAAHGYFSTVLAQWLGTPDSKDFEAKAKELTDVLLDGLQIVSIELEATENSQEIFETLNARGTPLTAADLVRNFVFQRLEAEGGDTLKAYREDWPFETKFWMREVSVGRNLVSRSSLFLNQWLVARTGEEISPQSTFTRFKSYVEHEAAHKMADLLPVIKQQAEQYQAWTEAAARPGGSLGVTEMAVYRMQAGGVEVLKPLLIWLHEPGRFLPSGIVDAIVRAAESWVVRRQFLRLSGSDLGRIVADVIGANSSVPADELVERVVGHLARLNVTSTYWPGDEEVRATLATESAYSRFPRGRLRMFLEAADDHYRAETGQPQIERKGYPIEHLLPRSWKDTWPVESPEDAEARQARVHRFGNLTLLTRSLNSKVSNGPWSAKRAALLDHNTITLTGRVIKRTEGHVWDEELIDERTSELIAALLHVWPVPEGHHGKVVDPQTKAGDWVELKHLIEAGHLAPGDKLVATHRDFKGKEAVLTPDGAIELDGKRFTSPSAAGHSLRKKATNGWYFWAVADGRRLRDVRAEFQNAVPADEALEFGNG
ncbi:GmrSD restriction endonuclease domain-containing protein [Georgenia sp.]